jgi:hypothetical protein
MRKVQPLEKEVRGSGKLEAERLTALNLFPMTSCESLALRDADRDVVFVPKHRLDVLPRQSQSPVLVGSHCHLLST